MQSHGRLEILASPRSFVEAVEFLRRSGFGGRGSLLRLHTHTHGGALRRHKKHNKMLSALTYYSSPSSSSSSSTSPSSFPSLTATARLPLPVFVFIFMYPGIKGGWGGGAS